MLVSYEILKLLNDRFGTNFEPEDEEFLETLEQKLDQDQGLAASFSVNTRENALLTCDHKVRDHVQDMIDTNFKFFKHTSPSTAPWMLVELRTCA
jgi:type I restriction enzyme R subunit